MRFTAEYLPDRSQVLVRLLGTPTVQSGLYLVDGTPELPEVQSLEVDPRMVQNNEVDFYFVGYQPLPQYLIITLPDTSTQTVQLINMGASSIYSGGAGDITIRQESSVLEPYEPSPHNPGESQGAILTVKESQLPPVIPDFWLSLNFENTDPLTIGHGLTSSGLEYSGGCQGRALSSNQRQKAEDYGPWLQGVSPRLEGTYTNLLQRCTFNPTESVPGFFDKLPVDWSVGLQDPDSLLRVDVDSGGLTLPMMTLSWTPRPNSQVLSENQPSVTVLTPTVGSGQTFQIIADPGRNNAAPCRVRLASYDLSVLGPVESLDQGPKVLRLETGSFAGRIRILWFQDQGENDIQRLKLIGPIVTSSSYIGAHSWAPYNIMSTEDHIITTLTPPQKWSFEQGSIRISSTVEDPQRPFSWALESTNSSESFIRLSGGILSSSYSSTPLDLRPYLTSGEYKLKWTTPTSFKLVDTANPQGLSIPFSLNLSIPDPVLLAPMKVELQSFGPSEGTAIVKLFRFSSI